MSQQNFDRSPVKAESISEDGVREPSRNSGAPVQEDEEKRSNSLTVWGLIASGIYILILAGLSIWSSRSLLDLKPNEFGDLLAGIFSPLAFLWLVLGFLQQGQELRASVRALRLQGEELSKSVEQQSQLVEVAREEFNLQSQRLSYEDMEADRQAQPKLEIVHNGHSGGQVATELTHSFDVKNYGVRAARLEVAVDGNNPLVKQNMFDTGSQVRFKLSLPQSGRAEKRVRIGYVDLRGKLRSQYWVILIQDGKISLGEEDQMKPQRS